MPISTKQNKAKGLTGDGQYRLVPCEAHNRWDSEKETHLGPYNDPRNLCWRRLDNLDWTEQQTSDSRLQYKWCRICRPQTRCQEAPENMAGTGRSVPCAPTSDYWQRILKDQDWEIKNHVDTRGRVIWQSSEWPRDGQAADLYHRKDVPSTQDSDEEEDIDVQEDEDDARMTSPPVFIEETMEWPDWPSPEPSEDEASGSEIRSDDTPRTRIWKGLR